MKAKGKGERFWCRQCHAFKNFVQESNDKEEKLVFLVDDKGHYKMLNHW